LADVRELGAIHPRFREIATCGNSSSPITHHHQVIHDEDRRLADAPPVGQRKADRRMRELEIPLCTNTAVFNVPVRHSFAVKTEIDVFGITDTRGRATTTETGVEQAIVERKSLFL